MADEVNSTEKTEDEIKANVENLNIKSIDGIDVEITTKLKKLKINTIQDLINTDVALVSEKTKIPLNKIIELQKKAQLLTELRFDEDIIESLGEKNYTIEQAIEESTKSLIKITNKNTSQISHFVDKLKQITIYLDVKTCRTTPVTILQTFSAKTAEDERLSKLLLYIEIALIIALAMTLTMTFTMVGILV